MERKIYEISVGRSKKAKDFENIRIVKGGRIITTVTILGTKSSSDEKAARSRDGNVTLNGRCHYTR